MAWKTSSCPYNKLMSAKRLVDKKKDAKQMLSILLSIICCQLFLDRGRDSLGGVLPFLRT